MQIFQVILLCKSIKVMKKCIIWWEANCSYKTHHWNPGIGIWFSKSSDNKSQCWSELLSVSNRFWYEGKIELIVTICRNYEFHLLEVLFVKLNQNTYRRCYMTGSRRVGKSWGKKKGEKKKEEMVTLIFDWKKFYS